MKHSNVNKDINKGMNSRRQFITKAAAGGVVAAIASKTAWAGGHSATGCSVSGNLSGNLSQARDCSTANVEGRSPRTWKRVLGGQEAQPTLENVTNFKWKDVFGFGRSPFTCRDKSEKNIRKFLLTGWDHYDETNEALVVAYLNARSGLYPLPNGTSESNARAYVQGLYDDIKSGVFQKADVVAAVRATY
ncbi:hypothetical protein AVL55_14000 [Alteromonas macleodii]|uniref:Twin-arginine translocation signal domain-containing protein n=2 Tax=Alteromonas macleodii TaxID=28108 RepID=A0A126Q2C6_ALTMA|nr:hypothetical protein AVL55_14000 [Alteromonas macleodii]|tara:strand:+ start:2460 stop:3029 length:570 start_codon:yes stop_codon:yes gene_type:complete